ncbi:MAG: DUF1289 domain-containing protein [Pseudomonadota bacterium]
MESPCKLQCAIEPSTGWCHGCGRSGEEIAFWTTYTREERLNLMERLPERLAKMPPRNDGRNASTNTSHDTAHSPG